MAFGLKKHELREWKQKIEAGGLAFLTHYWLDQRFPDCTSVTKVGCMDTEKLINWGEQYGLKPEWIHHQDKYPHYDLFKPLQYTVLRAEGLEDHIKRFNITRD
ncbi:hypothetical protein [Amphibacillus sediminis]|uniref:hypothetical protein n=1 Tax=Amphibacillus sediminis TaxID=360185 RepID=UPI00082A30D1|nr:hypothetical protein [Amphibacillus sediminis]